MNILNKIIRHKKNEIDFLKLNYSISQLESSLFFERETISLKSKLISSNSGIIAEHKRKSPSKDIINNNLKIQDVIHGYQHAGVCGISVLTDLDFFGGTNDDLKITREIFEGPILRKEFILDEFQIIESKSLGADVILLIASVLTKQEIFKLSKLAKELNLEVLAEVHNENELDKVLNPYIDLIGVNNRDLKIFKADINISKNISKKIPSDFLKISESGIYNYNVVKDLRQYGFKGFLIGEYFMKTINPGFTASEFIKKIEV